MSRRSTTKCSADPGVAATLQHAEHLAQIRRTERRPRQRGRVQVGAGGEHRQRFGPVDQQARIGSRGSRDQQRRVAHQSAAEDLGECRRPGGAEFDAVVAARPGVGHLGRDRAERDHRRRRRAHRGRRDVEITPLSEVDGEHQCVAIEAAAVPGAHPGGAPAHVLDAIDVGVCLDDPARRPECVDHRPRDRPHPADGEVHPQGGVHVRDGGIHPERIGGGDARIQGLEGEYPREVRVGE